jgi:hypothetical protein
MALSTVTLKWLYGRVNGFGIEIASPVRSRSGDIQKDEFRS